MTKNDFVYKTLLNKPIEYLIKELSFSILFLSPQKNESFKRNVKFTLRDYIVGILDILKNNISWNSYSGLIKGNTLRKKHNEWQKLNIYEFTYKNILNKYLKKTSFTKELKYQSIDSTFIEDINGSKEAGYSGIYKRRKGESSKGIKISTLVTTNGIPLSFSIDSANKYDSPILPKVINKCIINCKTKQYQNNNRYKQYLLGDPGYDSKENIKLLKKKGYTPLIIQNIRNIKDNKKKRTLNKKQLKIYKKRIKIENYHSWIKKFPKIKSLYERNIKNYIGLLYIAISIIISRRININ